MEENHSNIFFKGYLYIYYYFVLLFVLFIYSTFISYDRIEMEIERKILIDWVECVIERYKEWYKKNILIILIE